MDGLKTAEATPAVTEAASVAEVESCGSMVSEESLHVKRALSPLDQAIAERMASEPINKGQIERHYNTLDYQSLVALKFAQRYPALSVAYWIMSPTMFGRCAFIVDDNGSMIVGDVHGTPVLMGCKVVLDDSVEENVIVFGVHRQSVKATFRS